MGRKVQVVLIKPNDKKEIYGTIPGKLSRTKKGKGLAYTVDRPSVHGYVPSGEAKIARAFHELAY